MDRKILAAILVATILVSFAVYDYYISATEPKGTITVSGAFALYPMMVKWAGEFQKIHAKVRIDVTAGGAGKGMTDVLSELVDIAMVSRQIYPAEVDRGAFGLAVARDAVVATISKDNPVLNEISAKGVNRRILAGIYIYGNITTWGQVVGRPEITDRINVYTRSDSAGAADVWASYLGAGYTQQDLQGIGVFGDPGLADAVKSDHLGIGFNNINYAYDNKTGEPVEGIVVVPLDLNENGRLDENEDFYKTRAEIIEAIASELYPSPPARELYLVTLGKPSGLAKEFLKWILEDGQKYCSETGYLPLSDARSAQELAKLEEG